MNSLQQILSTFGNIVQKHLFPALEEELGELDEQHRQLVRVLAMLNLDRFVAVQPGPGRRPKHRANILRALVAKACLGIPETHALIRRLQCDTALRRICGWELAASVPDESTFSRTLARVASTRLLERVHAALIERCYRDRLVGHISRDATAIEVREKPRRKVNTPPVRASRKRGPKTPDQMSRIERQALPETTLEQMLAELPRHCDKGCKTNSHGSTDFWIGYKLHLDVADGQVPVSCVLTSASVHDSQVAIPLATMTAGRVTNLYDLMDRGYESQYIEQHSRQLGHVPIVDRQKRHGQKPEFAPHQKVRYRERTTVERAYARLKDEFGGRFIRVRGNAKVMAHLMFGVLVLTVDQILRLGGLVGSTTPCPCPS